MKMNCKIINVLMFAAGAVIGSAVTWRIVKAEYERIAQEEADAFSVAYAQLMADTQEQSDDDDETEDEDEEGPHSECTHIDWSDLEDLDEESEDEEDAPDEDAPDEDDLNDYAKLVNEYTNFEEKGGAEDMAKDPYVIAPYDFGELDGYHQIELTYYEGDDVLEDEDYNIVTDRDELLGPKALMTYGEYEEDAVFVRNERLRTDFQILKDYRKYSDVRSVGPDQVDDE